MRLIVLKRLMKNLSVLEQHTQAQLGIAVLLAEWGESPIAMRVVP